MKDECSTIAGTTERILSLAFRNAYPIVLDAFDAMKLNCDLPKTRDGPDDVLAMLEPLITDLDERLDAAEA